MDIITFLFGLGWVISVLFAGYDCNKRYNAMHQKKTDLHEKMWEELSAMDDAFLSREDRDKQDVEWHHEDKQRVTEKYERWIKEEQENYNSKTLNLILLFVL